MVLDEMKQKAEGLRVVAPQGSIHAVPSVTILRHSTAGVLVTLGHGSFRALQDMQFRFLKMGPPSKVWEVPRTLLGIPLLS